MEKTKYEEINVLEDRIQHDGIDLIGRENIQNTDYTFVKDIEEEAKNINDATERGIINEKNGSSILIKDNGDIALAANKFSQIKVNNYDKSINEISQSKNLTTNRLSIKTNDIEINSHKMNQRLWELADQRILLHDKDYSIGNLNASGYVLIKHWEAELEKWVLIRRKIRLPIFYPEMTLPDAPKQMGFDTEIDFGTQGLAGVGSDIIMDSFGISESDPAYQDAESKEKIHEEDHIIDSQKIDPMEDNFIDMGPIDSNTGNLIHGSGNISNESNNSISGVNLPNSNADVSGNAAIPKIKPGVKAYDLNKTGNIQLSKNLKLSHFRCKDGNPIVLIDPKLIDLLEKVFIEVGSTKFNITSAFRTTTHNRRVGGVPNSQHLYGKAVDITFRDVSPQRVDQAAKKCGAGYAYHKRGFCHMDVR